MSFLSRQKHVCDWVKNTFMGLFCNYFIIKLLAVSLQNGCFHVAK